MRGLPSSYSSVNQGLRLQSPLASGYDSFAIHRCSASTETRLSSKCMYVVYHSIVQPKQDPHFPSTRLPRPALACRTARHRLLNTDTPKPVVPPAVQKPRRRSLPSIPKTLISAHPHLSIARDSVPLTRRSPLSCAFGIRPRKGHGDLLEQVLDVVPCLCRGLHIEHS